MNRKNTTTRILLLESAAELFSEHGFSGTSIKMIADKSGQNIAAVNYHFGSKKNLFIQTLKTVLGKIMAPEVIHDDERRKPESRLAAYVKQRCGFLLSSKTPSWYGRLIIRAVFAEPSSVEEMGVEFISPDFLMLENLAIELNPQLSLAQAKLWAYSVVGQIFFYILGKSVIQMANPPGFFSEQNVELIAKHICNVSLGCFNEVNRS